MVAYVSIVSLRVLPRVLFVALDRLFSSVCFEIVLEKAKIDVQDASVVHRPYPLESA